jgi:exoribonuclease-2
MKLDGRIVEYLENGKFICGFAHDDNGSRLRLLNQNSRELSLPLNRIIYANKEKAATGLSRDEVIALLKDTFAQREKLAQTIALHEIWEIVSDKPEDVFDVYFLAGLFFGNDPSDNQTAAFIRSVLGDRLYFKFKSGSIHVHSPETVEQIKHMQEKEEEEEHLINTSGAALRHLWETGNLPDSLTEHDTGLQVLKDYYLYGKEAPEYALARKLIKVAQLTGPHDIFHLLVKADIWDRNENIHLLKYDIPTTYSDAALEEIEEQEIPTVETASETPRKDFRELSTLTIDGPATKDFDDALHIERQGNNYLVGIHISDVAHFVKPGTKLFEEALKRGTSLYLPEKPLSMLPASLSEDKLSLLKDQERPAVSFLVLLSPTAEVLSYELVHSIISVKRQLTYEEADRLIAEDNDLTALASISQLLRKRRVENGALLLPVPELNIKIQSDDSIVVNRSEVDTPSRILIAEFMILANTLGAQFVSDREAPGLFRCQMEPRQRIIDGFEKELFRVIQQRKKLSPMSLLTTPKMHSGVGAPQYTTVTSPIRRLLDLIMQLQIKNLIKGKGVFFSKKDMKHFGSIILETLDKANQVKHSRQRYWILKYLESKIGERLPATVIDHGTRRIHVYLEDFLLDADLPLNQAFKVSPGDTILVKIAKVDPLGNIFKIEW